MAVKPVTLSWPGVPGALGYLVEIKEQSSSTWTTPGPPLNPANPTLNLSYEVQVEEGITYDVRLSTLCAQGAIKYRYTTIFDPLSPSFGWIEDTYSCEQDTPFVLTNTYTGFSSPQGIFWDEPTGLFYVVDVDDVQGNVWTFDPDTITGFPSATHITGPNAPLNMYVTTHALDSTNRRIWTAGDDTGGARVLDIASGTWTFLSYGVNSSLGNSARNPVILSSSTAYCFSNNEGTSSGIKTFDLSTITPTGTILFSSIPSQSTYLTQSYGVTFVGSEAWVWAGSRSNGNIAVYNNTFTSLLATITLPGIATPGSPWTPNPSFYWQSHFYDEINNRWYVGDTGSNQIIIIDTVAKTIIKQEIIINLRGRDHAATSFFRNELTGEIFASVACANFAGDPNTNNKLYRLTDSGIAYVYPDESTAALKLRLGTNEAFGVQQNLTKPQAGAWATDGLVFKYTL